MRLGDLDAFEASKIEHKAYNDGFKDGVDQGLKLSKGLKGEWIVVDKDHVSFRFKICSNCGKEAEWLDGGSQFLSNFCPYCGADMRKGGSSSK